MTDGKNFVQFNSDRQYGQNQYATGYIKGDNGKPPLGKGLRWIINKTNYHDTKIHKDDEVRFDLRWNFYKLLLMLGLDDHAENMVSTIKDFGELRSSDPSHYEYLLACYGFVCTDLEVPDHYNGHFSSHGDKMYQYRDKWIESGIPWFHGVVCYTLAISVYPREIGNTKNGWVCPSDWVIQNYTDGKKLQECMADHTLIHTETMLKWG
jgi:hypothetical protein